MKVLQDVPLAPFCTWRVGGPAPTVYWPTTVAEAQEAFRLCRESGRTPLVIGGGSNLLISDKGIDRPVIRMADNFVGVTFDGDRATALAGTRLSQLVQRAMEHGLGGLEFASGIPGTVGGAAVMNAGCFGGMMSEHVVSVTVVAPSGEVVEVPAADLGYSYRASNLQGGDRVVLAVTVQLEARPTERIAADLARMKAERTAKQPLSQLTAGSTFRNPPGVAAARLLEDAGLKGLRCGHCEISERHVNFIVNLGGGTANEIVTLMAHMRDRVLAMTGIALHAEVVEIGEFEVVPGWAAQPAAAP